MLNNRLRMFSIAGFPQLHYTPSLADVTMEINACTLPKAVKLYYNKLNKLRRMK
jgi:hypothetical protein